MCVCEEKKTVFPLHEIHLFISKVNCWALFSESFNENWIEISTSLMKWTGNYMQNHTIFPSKVWLLNILLSWNENEVQLHKTKGMSCAARKKIHIVVFFCLFQVCSTNCKGKENQLNVCLCVHVSVWITALAVAFRKGAVTHRTKWAWNSVSSSSSMSDGVWVWIKWTTSYQILCYIKYWWKRNQMPI